MTRYRLPRHPADLVCLLPLGFGAEDLDTLAREARRIGVAPHEVAIGARRDAEAAYYRALAEALGLPFVDARRERLAPAALDPDNFGVAALARIAPTIDGRFLLTPRGREVALLVEQLRRRGGMDRRLALTTPSDLREALIAQGGPAILAAAVDRLARRRPDLSAHGTTKRIGWAAALGAVCAAGLTAADVLVPGLGTLVPLLALTALFAIGLGLRIDALRLAFASPPPAPALLADAELPLATILLPLRAEAAMIPQLMAALERIDYPAAKLEIIALLEADDRATHDAIRAHDRHGRWIPLVVPEGAPRTKPRALQVGLVFARGEIVTIYDAEDEPDPDQLRRAASALASGGRRLACVQARLAVDAPRSWLERQFALEYDALFGVILPGLARRRLPLPLGGTSNIFRAEALRRALGWDPWNVTEDADLGLRLTRLGYRVSTLDNVTWEEAPARLGVWMRQRRRWMKGWMQTLLVHLSRPRRLVRELGPVGVCALIGMLGGTLAAALVYPMTIAALVVAIVADGPALSPAQSALFGGALAIFLAGHAAPLAVALVGGGKLGTPPRFGDVVTLPFYWLLVSAAAWWAVWDLIRKPYHWFKTPHRGRRRSSNDALRTRASRKSGLTRR